MDRLLRSVVLITGILAAPLTQAVDETPPAKLQVEAWSMIGHGLCYTVEIDMNTVNINLVDGYWQIFARLRTKYEPEIKIAGKKPGSYAISDTIAICKEDKLVIGASTLFTKTGEPIESVKLKTMPNPHMSDNFVSSYLNSMCNSAKNYKPPLNI